MHELPSMLTRGVNYKDPRVRLTIYNESRTSVGSSRGIRFSDQFDTIELARDHHLIHYGDARGYIYDVDGKGIKEICNPHIVSPISN